MSHVHLHAPPELTEDRPAEPAAVPPPRSERRLELVAVLVLALTTLATAWAGYQAARWSGEQSQHYARASTERTEAVQASTRAGQLAIGDLVNFNQWLDARSSGDQRLAAAYRSRFRAEFVPAFDAWLAQRPFTRRNAVPGPLYMPQYRSTDAARSSF